jgi:hypothetical protein
MEDNSLNYKAAESTLSPMPDISSEERAGLAALDAKINALLPARYQGCYEAVKPVSMGSAGLKFGPDGKVAWDEIWTSFCDLALAGGPPHRGTLLEPAPAKEVYGGPELYQAVVDEIGRGIWLVTELPVLPRMAPGWVGVRCHDEEMAGWLVRALVVENISARQERDFICVPAGPHFRLAKEIKNVVTAVAKTWHYWTDHMPESQRAAVAAMIGGGAATDAELLEPGNREEAEDAPEKYETMVCEMERAIQRLTGLPTVRGSAPGWVGVQCAHDEMAVWLVRALIVENILARREGPILCLPANPKFTFADRTRRVVETLSRAYRLWAAQRNQPFRG